MAIDPKTKREIEKRSALFDEAKEKIKKRIQDNVEIAINKLKGAEDELLKEVEIEFGENPFSAFLTEKDHPEEDIKAILSRGIPSNFGPSEESFYSLLREIESFKSWRTEPQSLSDSIPKTLECIRVTHDSITLAWDHVNFFCSYEIEITPSTPLLGSSTNRHRTFKSGLTLCGLKPDTGYSIRIRTVAPHKEKTSIWSDPITAKTGRKPYKCEWVESPDDAEVKYSVDEKNHRIATVFAGVDMSYCTIIGNASLPTSKVTSWCIRILNSEENNGICIYIGVAPSDINRYRIDNWNKYGWYIGCYSSALWSGPPHNFNTKPYGPRKEQGKYIRTGDSVGVVMDTAKGELSYVLAGINHGVAYEGIPLDKPLVPCVLLGHMANSVELLI